MSCSARSRPTHKPLRPPWPTRRPAENLLIAGDLDGLTIDGASEGGRAAIRGSTGAKALVVAADSTTLSHLVVQSLSVQVEGPAQGTFIQAVRVEGNRFEGAREGLNFRNSRDAIITGNEFAIRGKPAVDLHATKRTQLIDNTWEPQSRVMDEASKNLQVSGNTWVDGQLNLRSYTLNFEGNTLTGGRLAATGQMGTGATVTGNTFTAMPNMSIRIAAATTLRFADNQVTGLGLSPVFAECVHQQPITQLRKLFVERNTFTTAGLVISCVANGKTKIDVVRNTITGAGAPGIDVRSGKNVSLRGNTIKSNRTGIEFSSRASGTVNRGTIKNNRGPGVLAGAGSMVDVRSTLFGGNSGAGIDLAPRGTTPNGMRKLANNNLDWPRALRFDKKKGKLRGFTCPGCTVTIWEAEDGDKNGEGLRVIDQITAPGTGKITYPKRGALKRPETGLLSVTVTTRGKRPVTSEFSEDITCACVLNGAFKVDPRIVPPHGFANQGLIVFFKKGSKPGHAVLTDTKTDLRPPDNAFAPITWQEFQKQITQSVFFEWDYFVSLTNAPDSPAGLGPAQIWNFSIPYEPPPTTKACEAYLKYPSVEVPEG